VGGGGGGGLGGGGGGGGLGGGGVFGWGGVFCFWGVVVGGWGGGGGGGGGDGVGVVFLVCGWGVGLWLELDKEEGFRPNGRPAEVSQTRAGEYQEKKYVLKTLAFPPGKGKEGSRRHVLVGNALKEPAKSPPAGEVIHHGAGGSLFRKERGGKMVQRI